MKTRNMTMPVSSIPGVGKTTSDRLAKLGIFTFEDLVYYFPKAYEHRGNIRTLSKFDTENKCSYILTVATDVKTSLIRKGLTISKFRAFDESGSCEIVFFNSPYIKDVFTVGEEFRFWGKIALSGKKLQLQNPDYEHYRENRELPDFFPIYPLTEGLSSKKIDKLVKFAVNEVLPELTDPLPEAIRLGKNLPTLTYAIQNSHFPRTPEDLKISLKRLAFDEMLSFGLSISMRAAKKHKEHGIKFAPCSLTPLLKMLPYNLTDAQKKAVNDIYRDTVIPKDGENVYPMSRILIGDVGCGKTICAIIAMYICAMSKYQSAMMAPTEILARQHYDETKKLFDNLGIRVEILLGSTPQKQKKLIYESVENGEIDVIIGTHALISDKLIFNKLGLIITDEQHRFGVMQRAKLKEKTTAAHLLVMSATPIPRTLALAMYGDLDTSKITDMPKGRQKVDTFVVNESYRSRLNDFIKNQILLGGQCYIVCPAIEKSEDCNALVPSSTGSLIFEKNLNLKNVTEHAEELRASLPQNIVISTLHGKMKTGEKESVIRDFNDGKIHVLISTTVIEVGVNVPNATLMVIENAERFGLSQLHQLRGRVGRGSKKAYCILVAGLSGEKIMARMNIMKESNDGFKIAEQDLIMRGPGDFFSKNPDNNFRQSGGFDFKFASMCDDTDLFSSAFSTAKEIINLDPELNLPEHQQLKEIIIDKINTSESTIS